jgi:hypothetical protein
MFACGGLAFAFKGSLLGVLIGARKKADQFWWSEVKFIVT